MNGCQAMRKGIVLLVLLLGLTACSTKFSYHFLDWVIGWEQKDYVTLDKEQQKAFDLLVKKFILWHQSEELILYANQLAEIQRLLKTNSLTPELWAEQVAIAKGHWVRSYEFVLPKLLPIVRSFSDEQVKQVLTKIRDNEGELEKEFTGKTPEQLQKDADKKLVAQFDDWLGSVSASQKTLIQQYNQQRLATLALWFEYRHEWVNQFELALAQRADERQLTERLRLLVINPDELKSEQHKALVRKNTEASGALILNVYASLSAKQSNHFYRKLNKLIQDLSELDREGKDKLAKAMKE